MLPLISVIVPIYNVEKYLCECLDSILNQTYTNIEVILVDDGSPDNCGIICDEYSKKDTRIKVIHQKNAGVGNARNEGLKSATGEHLIFFDPDDVVDLDIIMYLYEMKQKYQADISYCDYRYTLQPNAHSIPKIRFEKQKPIMLFLDTLAHSACSKLYPQKIKDFKFSSLSIGEDMLFNAQVIAKCQPSLIHTSNTKYYYRPNLTSATKSRFTPSKLDGFTAIYYSFRNYKKAATTQEDNDMITQFCVTTWTNISLKYLSYKNYLQFMPLFNRHIDLFRKLFPYDPKVLFKARSAKIYWFCVYYCPKSIIPFMLFIFHAVFNLCARLKNR